ncbi:MAG TPA: PAC2 family protein [Microbacteriaceae bacterium]|nr:PAC2 family protein [Microbacteriaceae bacterium]
MEDPTRTPAGRVLVVAFDGWNDAGDAASTAVRILRDSRDVVPVAQVDPETYFDFQFARPTVSLDEDGRSSIHWPEVVLSAPAPTAALPHDAPEVCILSGTEPSRNWKAFTAEIVDAALTAGVEWVILLGAMLADVPHTRPISVFASSSDARVRARFGLERSTYEGPTGILGVLADATERAGLPTVSVWASVPHYVHNAPSPKATLALIGRLEELIGVSIPHGNLAEQSAAWEAGIDALAADDEDMAAYIKQLEQARDTVESPDASGDAIAQEFERYLRRRGDDGRGDEPWHGGRD